MKVNSIKKLRVMPALDAAHASGSTGKLKEKWGNLVIDHRNDAVVVSFDEEHGVGLLLLLAKEMISAENRKNQHPLHECAMHSLEGALSCIEYLDDLD